MNVQFLLYQMMGVLRTFKISFEVTEAPTYKIELVSDNVNYG